MLGCNRYRLLPPVTGDVRGSVTRGTGGRGLGVLGCNRYRLLPPVTGDVRGSMTRRLRARGSRVLGLSYVVVVMLLLL